jgi:hypothetical protein
MNNARDNGALLLPHYIFIFRRKTVAINDNNQCDTLTPVIISA